MRDVRKRVNEALAEDQISLLEKASELLGFVKNIEAAITDTFDVKFEGRSYYGDDGVEIHGVLSNDWVKYAGGKPEFILDIQIHDNGTFNAHITASFGSENNQYSAIKKPMEQGPQILIQLVKDFQHIVKSNHDPAYRSSLN